MTPPRVVLAGAAGYGRTYLRELDQLERQGRVRVAGVCTHDRLDAEGARLIGDRPVERDLGSLLRRTGADIGIVSTPVHTHHELARTMLAAGAHLLLEKPPTATLAGWRDLLSYVEASSLVCQVGFQSFGSAALAELVALVASGGLGHVRGIGACGAWSRTDGYYRRANWAGRRTLDGADVCDGALTNPFAHAVATALAIDGATTVDSVVSVELELFRSRDIEADDTSCVRLLTERGTPVVVAVTLCAEQVAEPVVIVHGTRGRAELYYTEDVLVVDGVAHSYGRTSPFENLLARLTDSAVPLQAPLEHTGAFMRVLEDVRRAADPEPIASRYLRSHGVGDERFVVVDGVEKAVREAAEQLLTFSERGVPWAIPR